MIMSAVCSGLISLGTHLIEANIPDHEEGFVFSYPNNLDVGDDSSGPSSNPPAPSALFSSKTMSSLSYKLKKKSSSSSQTLSGMFSSSKSVKVNMQRGTSTTNLIDEDYISDYKDVLNLKFDCETYTPSHVWYPYIILPSRGERVGERVTEDRFENEKSSLYTAPQSGDCLECLLDTTDLILNIRTGQRSSNDNKNISSESYLRVPWSKVTNVVSITESSIFMTIRGVKLKERISEQQRKFRRKDDKNDISLDAVVNRSVKFAKRLSPPPIQCPDSDMDREHNMDFSENRAPPSLKKQNSFSALMKSFRSSSKKKSFEDQTHEKEITQEIDIIIGPCDSDVLVSIIEHRINMNGIHDALKNLIEFNREYCKNSLQEGEVCMIFVKAMNILQMCFEQVDKYSNRKFVPVILEENIDVTQSTSGFVLNAAAVRRLHMYISVLLSLTSPLHEKYRILSNSGDEQVYETLERACSLVRERRVHRMSSNEGQTFEESRKMWIEKIQEWSDLGDDDLSESDSDLESGKVSSIAVCDVIDLLEDIKQSCVNSVQLSILVGTHMMSEDTLARILNIIESHYTLIRQVLGCFLAEEEALEILQGQNDKTILIKYLIINDRCLAYELQTILSVFGMSCSPEPVLLGTIGIKEAMRLYSRCMIAETRKWLYKLINQSKSTRELSCNNNLPWDIEEIGGKIMSSIPETLRYQLNAYAELLQSNETINIIQNLPFSNALSCVELDEQFQRVGLHEEVLRALCKSLLLLPVEYSMVLKSKHWGSASEDKRGDEQTENLMFLVSLGNDSFRMQSVHVTELLRIESAEEWSVETNNLIGSIGAAYEELCGLVVNQICRLIFSDLLQVLTEFGPLWLSHNAIKASSQSFRKSHYSKAQSNLDPFSAVLLTVKDFLCDLMLRQEKVLFFDTFLHCVDIILMRYMIFILELTISLKCPLSADQITRIHADMSLLMDTFHEQYGFEIYGGVSLRINAVMDATRLLSATSVNDDDFEGEFTLYIKRLVLSLSKLYQNRYTDLFMTLVLASPVKRIKKHIWKPCWPYCLFEVVNQEGKLVLNAPRKYLIR